MKNMKLFGIFLMLMIGLQGNMFASAIDNQATSVLISQIDENRYPGGLQQEAGFVDGYAYNLKVYFDLIARQKLPVVTFEDFVRSNYATVLNRLAQLQQNDVDGYYEYRHEILKQVLPISDNLLQMDPDDKNLDNLYSNEDLAYEFAQKEIEKFIVTGMKENLYQILKKDSVITPDMDLIFQCTKDFYYNGAPFVKQAVKKWAQTKEYNGRTMFNFIFHQFYGKTTPLLSKLVEIIAMLIDSGADVNEEFSWSQAALNFAVEDNWTEIVQMLLEAGANVNVQVKPYSQSSLHTAAENNYVEIAQMLINAGANINIQDSYTLTPLHMTYSQEITQMLINAGADVNMKDMWNNTPLHYAIIKNSIEIAQLLIKAGADVNAKMIGMPSSSWFDQKHYFFKFGENLKKIDHVDKDGFTALHLAVVSHSIGMVQMLLSKGADMTIQDKDGKTAEQLATTDEMRELFEQVKKDREENNI